MELVLEIGKRRAPRFERIVLGSEPAVLGRAFSSDVLLQDKTVDPAHATLALQADALGQTQVLVQDLGSANGSRLNGKQLATNEVVPLESGDLLRLGNAQVRVFRRDHPVGPAHSPTRVEQLQDSLSQGPAILIVTLLSLGLFVAFDYLHFAGDFKANIAVRKVMDFGVQAGLWMLLWATVSKLIRGEFNFWPHWCVGAALVALIPALDEGLGIIGFNWQSLAGYRLLDAIASATVIAGSVFIALSFATHMQFRARLGIAVAPALLMLVTSYALPMLTEQRNVARPQMLLLSRPPAFKWVGSTPASALISDSAKLFADAQTEASKQLKAEAAEAARTEPATP